MYVCVKRERYPMCVYIYIYISEEPGRLHRPRQPGSARRGLEVWDSQMFVF